MRKKREIEKYIVDLIIVLEALLIGMSYYQPHEVTKYYLFSIVSLCMFLGVLSIFKIISRYYKNTYIIAPYLTLIVGTLTYNGLFRDSIPFAIIFISSVAFLLYMYFFGIDKKNMNLIIVCNIPLVVLHYIGSLNNSYFDYHRNSLVLVYENPNMAGIVISSTGLILITGMFYVKKQFQKVALAILSLVCLYLIFITNNRGSLLSVFLFVIILVWTRGNRINRVLRYVLILFPVLFAFVYTSLVISVPQYIVFLGKPLFSGRELEWKYLISFIINKPFFIHLLPMGGLNMALAGIVEFGIVAFCAYMALLVMMKPEWNECGKLRYKKIAYLAFLCVFVQQAVESTLVLGAYGVYIFNYLLMGIACSPEEVRLVPYGSTQHGQGSQEKFLKPKHNEVDTSPRSVLFSHRVETDI